ncbi:GNAT family N-acetyltransferase [Desulfitobacterium sp.]|uniref:GNAT family N-acetyltransferase n=1 Tax=Desulfitobacterium sp. TaxID=49981 RepID=UPI002BE8529A|nr:GNAT family N-acetyltransferase [Desulfitobacterium sp.]HVJ48574.1 GNAT family N-acetyltransferase [Desulfitobacterium sp.]
MVELTTLEGTNSSLLTEAWNRCWQGYFYEMFFTEENLRIWIGHGEIELKHSIALKEQGKIVGFTFLSQTGSDGWIAGTAIDPHYRGRKLFAPMLQAQIKLAHTLGLKRIYLEVLSDNYAQRTYQALGFRYVRDLHLFRLTPGVLNLDRARSPFTDFHREDLSIYFLARKKANFVPSWQRRAHYLKRYTSINAWLNSQETAGMLYAGAEGRILLDAWAAYDDSAQELLSSLNERDSGKFSLTNQPQDPITRILTFAGIRPSAILCEMVCEIND